MSLTPIEIKHYCNNSAIEYSLTSDQSG